MLAKIYDKLARSFWGGYRRLIRRFLEEFDCSPGLYIVKLPTGYGKTSIVFAHALSTLAGYCSSSTIYVAPLRSLVDDVYDRWKHIASRIMGNDVVEEVSGVQHMGVAGSIYLNKPVVYTTMDTFLLHLFKLPPAELKHYVKARLSQQYYRGHYEVSRGVIANSTIILDEPHLTIHSTAMLKSFLAALRFLAYIKSVVIVMTATLPRKLELLLSRSVKGYLDNVRKYSYGDEDFVDEEFEKEQSNKIIETELKLNKQIGPEDIVEASSSYDRVLVVVNRRSKAVNLYASVEKLLKSKGIEDRLFLLHGFMLEKEREKIAVEIRKRSKENKPFILLTTQVIEAGFDISSDVLLTEVAPAPSIVQRVGRVARWSEKYGKVVIYGVRSSEPYTQEDVVQARKMLEEYNGCILWRKPKGGDNRCLGYVEFVENATVVRDKGIMGDVYNVADYVLKPTSTITIFYKVFSGELLREKPLLISLYVRDRLEEGSIPVDLNTLSLMLGKGKISGYIVDNKVVLGEEKLGELRKIIDVRRPVETLINLEALGVKGLVIDDRTYGELAYGRQ